MARCLHPTRLVQKLYSFALVMIGALSQSHRATNFTSDMVVTQIIELLSSLTIEATG